MLLAGQSPHRDRILMLAQRRAEQFANQVIFRDILINEDILVVASLDARA